MPRPESRQASTPPDPSDAVFRTADRVHSAAIHLLRRVRAEDVSSGLSGPKLSALSVVVFGGPLSPTALADAEQVRPPTMTKLVHELERSGLVERVAHATDRRSHLIRATPKGKRLLEQGRRRRVTHLARAIARLTPAERQRLDQAVELLERLARPPD